MKTKGAKLFFDNQPANVFVDEIKTFFSRWHSP